MLRKWWDGLSVNSTSQAKALESRLDQIEKDIERLHERILDLNEPRVIAAYEEKVHKLEEEKIALRERMANLARPKSSFDDTLRLAASVADAGHSSLLSCVQAGRWYAAPTAVILVEQSESRGPGKLWRWRY